MSPTTVNGRALGVQRNGVFDAANTDDSRRPLVAGGRADVECDARGLHCRWWRPHPFQARRAEIECTDDWQQHEFFAAQPPPAAVPGTSNHGWGIAVDVPFSDARDPLAGYTKAERRWLREYDRLVHTHGAHAKMFLAQVLHESAGLQFFEEIASGAAYEGRCRDLGNCQPGDGRRFKGRGPIQLTGRANYHWAAKRLGLALEQHPEVAAQHANGWRIAGLYWKSRGLNELADRGDFPNGSGKRPSRPVGTMRTAGRAGARCRRAPTEPPSAPARGFVAGRWLDPSYPNPDRGTSAACAGASVARAHP